MKYRKVLLTKDLALRLKELNIQICSDMNGEVIFGVVSKDHVHILISMPPQVCVRDEIIKSYSDNHIEGDDTFHIEE